MRHEGSKLRRFLRPSVLLIAGGALVASLPLFLFPGGEVRLVASAVVIALTAVLHRAATTTGTRGARWRHDGRAEQHLQGPPIPVRVEESS
jgi:hypothetical protein